MCPSSFHVCPRLSSLKKAAESITKIAGVLSQAQLERYYIPLVKRLSNGEWFTSRTSSASLYSAVYARVSPTIQEALRKDFTDLSKDDTPMVRRAAAKWLGVWFCIPCVVSILIFSQPLLTHLSQDHLLSDGLLIYHKLQSDDQDSVRLLTIEDLIILAQRMSPVEIKEHLLKQIRNSIVDKSWRVRYMAASHFNEVSVSSIGTFDHSQNILRSLPKLLGLNLFGRN